MFLKLKVHHRVLQKTEFQFTLFYVVFVCAFTYICYLITQE